MTYMGCKSSRHFVSAGLRRTCNECEFNNDPNGCSEFRQKECYIIIRTVSPDEFGDF